MGKISEIQYIGHPVFNDINVKITQDKTFSKDNYITLLIGENGSGKSEFLKSIIQSLRQEPNDKQILSKMTMTHSGVNKKVRWPRKVIACSLSVSDKFPYCKNSWSEDDFYFYAGPKTASNNIFIGKYREDLFRCFNITCKDNFKEKLLSKCLEFMELPNVFEFKMTLGSVLRRKLNKLTENESFDPLLNIDETIFSIFERMGFDKHDSSKENEQVRDLSESVKKLYANPSARITIQMIIKESEKTNLNLMDFILHLIDEKILSVSELNEVSNNDFLNLSSGQFNLIRNIATIVSQLKNHSLLIVDEPEISLHPSWQIKFMDLIGIILKHFEGCHVIVASHSHLLATSLPLTFSNVLVSKKSNSFKLEPLDASPTGLSSDMLLYGVFGVLTRGNTAFESDLRTVTSLLNNLNLDNKSLLMEAMSRLNRYSLPGNDPLNEFLRKAQVKLERLK